MINSFLAQTPDDDPVHWLALALTLTRMNFAAYRIAPMDITADDLIVDRAQASVLLALRRRLRCTNEKFVAYIAERMTLVATLRMTSAPTVELLAAIDQRFVAFSFG